MKTEIETDEARILASLLGENDTADEHVAIARLLAANPALRTWHDEVRALLPHLRQAIHDTTRGNGPDPTLRMDPAQRIALVEKLRCATPARAANVIPWASFAWQNLGLLGACAVLTLACVAGIVSIVSEGKHSRHRAEIIAEDIGDSFGAEPVEPAQGEFWGGGAGGGTASGVTNEKTVELRVETPPLVLTGSPTPMRGWADSARAPTPPPVPAMVPHVSNQNVAIPSASSSRQTPPAMVPRVSNQNVSRGRFQAMGQADGIDMIRNESDEDTTRLKHGSGQLSVVHAEQGTVKKEDSDGKNGEFQISGRAGGKSLVTTFGYRETPSKKLSPPLATSPAPQPSATDIGSVRSGNASSGHIALSGTLISGESSDGGVIVRPGSFSVADTDATANPFSTFSLNVSDASFRLAAAALQRGARPDAATLRTEEFVNALAYSDPPPAPGQPVNLTQEQARDPHAHNRNYIRLSLQTAATGRDASQPLNLTILLDTSGSMERADRQATVATALRTLAGFLQPHDRVSLIGFARTPRIILDNLDGASAAARLRELPGTLPPDGGTNIELALGEAFRKNNATRTPHTHNRVALLTDGAANLGDADPARLALLIEEAKRRQGVTLDAYGIGYDDYNDTLLETLTRTSNGRYAYLNTPDEAREDFARKLAGALQVAAQNVKVQVEFNPARVGAYRLHGYNNHRLNTEDFRNNTVRAAQLTAAESGTALYSIQPKPDGTGPLGVLRVRYQNPQTLRYHEREWTIPYDPAPSALEHAPAGIRLAVAAALSAEKLAGESHAEDVPFKFLLKLVREANVVQGLAAGTNTAAWQLQSMLETLQREDSRE